MGLFVSGMWTAAVLGLWVWQISEENISGIIGMTILLVITALGIGAYLGKDIETS